MGLYYLAGVLKAEGISTTIMDFNIQQPIIKDFHKYLRKNRPKVIGVTSYTFNFSAAVKILEEVRRCLPRSITVLGGVHASALPGEVLRRTDALDYVVIGEGECTFLELCRRVLNGEEVKDLQGISLRDGGKIMINPLSHRFVDLDELPLPDRRMLPLEKYPVTSVQTSRGCPYSCIFCNINQFYGRRIRLRDPKRVVDECSILVNKYNKDNIFFFGDAFTINSDWVEEFCDEIIRRGLRFIWGCETRVDNVSLSLLRKMSMAGCREIQYGIDYGDEGVLKLLGKDISVAEISDAVRWAKEAGLFVGGFFIFNVPGENEETMERTFNLIQKVPVDAIEVNLLTPYPGTPIWHRPGDFGMRIINFDFDYYTTKRYVMENLNFPRDRFIPAFRRLLRRLNLVPVPGYQPEIYDFLERPPRIEVWRRRGFLGPLRSLFKAL
ncbi:B12-binding domain-containing radical SAM protein [Candidatus Bathyarchaeota archaeon]|nr:B12-binding domain-containing radical SAM protein [Candidatus Bathyarchaeota archaeon]